ncbi:MAG TPA: carbohydrate-binding domain-containing protein [Polyangiaceae bacterium]|nr:carbohydrate-binding domain-containing protein [Polyangiaceae bacterium]
MRNREHPIKGFASNGLPLFGVHVLPGTIAAATYDQFPLSGEGHTYHDLSPGNAGAQYRTGDVDIGSGRDGRPVLTNLEPTEWLTYTLHVPKPGAYRIEARYSATAADGALRFAFGAAAATEAIALPSTEGTSVTHTLASGAVLRVGVQACGFSWPEHRGRLSSSPSACRRSKERRVGRCRLTSG